LGILRIGIIGATTLKGKEIKDAVEDSPLAASEIVLLDDSSEAGKLQSIADEATFIQAVTKQSLQDLALAFFAGEARVARDTLPFAQAANCMLIDVSSALEGEPGFAVRSVWLEQDDAQRKDLEVKGAVIAHPVAISLALILRHLGAKFDVRTAAATVLHPVSETGHAGMDELHRQTVNLLNFQPLPREVFETQIAFNLVPDYGDGKATTTARVAKQIDSHLSAIAPEVFRPSLMVVAAPVFHAHTMSMYVEFESAVEVTDVEEALHAPHLSVIGCDAAADEQPNNINSAGEERVLISVRGDQQRKNAVWLWVAADNLKIAAVNAVDLARELLKLRPSGKVQ